ncbi:MAG: YhcH/YjgK/YiaL family protein [Treponema sp.]|nr:YhcH/YjgK/YiaL family protein [Treponema sp.]
MKDLNKIKELCPSAYDFIVNKAKDAAVGKYDLENGAYVSVQEYTTKARSEAKYEAHKKFIDIQMILSGKELIAVSPIEKMTISDEYNEEKDFMLFHHNDECTDYVLEAGEFLILYPQDVHMPGVCVNEKSPVRKIVVKVPVEK